MCTARASRLESAAVIARRGKNASAHSSPCGGARFADACSAILMCALLAHRAWNPPPSSSLAEKERLAHPLRAAARDLADARSAMAEGALTNARDGPDGHGDEP